jgi:hypothetical protein
MTYTSEPSVYDAQTPSYLDEFLQTLKSAQTPDEQHWFATKFLLDSLPDDVRKALWAASEIQWFDQEILADKGCSMSQDSWRRLIDLPCVEPFYSQVGYNVHELTARIMREHVSEK